MVSSTRGIGGAVGDDKATKRAARLVAYGILGFCGLVQLVALADPANRPFPEPLYGLAIVAAGFIFGSEVTKNGRS